MNGYTVTNGRWMHYFSCVFLWFISCLVILLGHSVRKNYVRIFLVAPLRKVIMLQPSFLQLLTFLNIVPLPSFLILVPCSKPRINILSPAGAHLPDLIGTIPPFSFPFEEPFDP